MEGHCGIIGGNMGITELVSLLENIQNSAHLCTHENSCVMNKTTKLEREVQTLLYITSAHQDKERFIRCRGLNQTLNQFLSSYYQHCDCEGVCRTHPGCCGVILRAGCCNLSSLERWDRCLGEEVERGARSPGPAGTAGG